MAVEWIGETPVVPSNLGPVPSFGPNGESPPLRTEPVIVSWAHISEPQIVGDDGSRRPPNEQEIVEFLEGSASLVRHMLSSRPLPGYRSSDKRLEEPMQGFQAWKAVKRVVYRQCWQRDDPVVQLVPGETQTYSIQLNSTLTDQALVEFSSNLGLRAKVSAVELSTQLSSRLSRTVTISTGSQTTATKQLTNTRDGYLRRVAVWRVVNSISLYRVAYASEPHLPDPEDRFEWKQIQYIEFADTSALQSTYLDIPVSGQF